MHVIRARNVHLALPEGVRHLLIDGIPKLTRGGECIVAPTPVTTVYQKPIERVVFWPQRDANPFLHLVEALWMLAGRNDVETLAYYASNMRKFSDDGKTLHGAYGYRWRKYFDFDQLNTVVKLLKNDPRTRRAVLQMWDCRNDLFSTEHSAPRDVPCNDLIFFWLNTGTLDMTVCCRSNDMIWGGYGTNAVHFSVLQEYLAARLGVEVGTYYQISNNFHAYTDVLKEVECLRDMAADSYRVIPLCPYSREEVTTQQLVDDTLWFDAELKLWFEDKDGEHEYKNRFLRTAHYIRQAFRVWKEDKNYSLAFSSLDVANQEQLDKQEPELDWVCACREWLERRQHNAKLKAEPIHG